MTNPNLTEIICVVDRSGSMQSIRDDAIGGFNTFLTDQQRVEGECRLTFTQFDDVYEIVYDGAPIKDVSLLDHSTFVPRGHTALLDAIGRTINTVGARFAKTPESERPSKVAFVILTDGHENASTEFDRQRVFDLITQQREKYQWEFVYLAAGQDALAVGRGMGITAVANFSHNAAGSRGIYSNLSKGMTSFRMTGATLDCGDAVIPDAKISKSPTTSKRH